MNKHEPPTNKPDPEPLLPKKREPAQPEKIDFTKLDLTIEKVEERITPSETNVFDK